MIHNGVVAPSVVPKPLPFETPRLLCLGAEVIFIHLNHTNPLWDPHSAASKELKRRGYRTGIETKTLLLKPTADA